MGKYSKEKQEKWLKLCSYVHKEILGYSEEMKFPKKLALRLKGLSRGQFLANNNIEPMAEYSFDDILLTFKINKLDILISAGDKGKFKDESHRINYIMVIIENKINDVVLRKSKLNKEKEIIESVEVQEGRKADYIKKTKKSKVSSRLSDLW